MSCVILLVQFEGLQPKKKGKEKGVKSARPQVRAVFPIVFRAPGPAVPPAISLQRDSSVRCEGRGGHGPSAGASLRTCWRGGGVPAMSPLPAAPAPERPRARGFGEWCPALGIWGNGAPRPPPPGPAAPGARPPRAAPRRDGLRGRARRGGGHVLTFDAVTGHSSCDRLETLHSNSLLDN